MDKTGVKFLSKNIQIGLTIAGVLVTLLNIWVASKIAPIAQDIKSVATEVKADSVRIDTLEGTASLYLPRFVATEQNVTNLKESINRIESSQTRLETKIDTYLLKK